MNLKEEIKRIKSLFSEERLYGNLVTETNPDTDNDGKISGKEFRDSGSEINRDEAIKFIKAKGGVSIFNVEDCDEVIDNTPHLKCVEEAFEESTTLKDDYVPFHQSRSAGCAIQVTNKKAILDNSIIKSLIYDDEN